MKTSVVKNTTDVLLYSISSGVLKVLKVMPFSIKKSAESFLNSDAEEYVELYKSILVPFFVTAII